MLTAALTTAQSVTTAQPLGIPAPGVPAPGVPALGVPGLGVSAPGVPALGVPAVDVPALAAPSVAYLSFTAPGAVAPSGSVPALALLALALGLLLLPGPPGRGRLAALTGAAAGGPARTLPVGVLLHVAGGAGGLLLLGPAGAVCGTAGVAVVRRRRERARTERLGAVASTELADALARITDELRTGAHPAAALAGVAHDGPWARELLAPAEAAARLGEPVPAALRRSAGSGAGRATAADLERVAAAWELADRHGAPLADLLAGTLDDIRGRLAHASRVRAQLAGPRATATVLTALPLVGIGLGQMMGTDPVGVLREGLLGQSLLVAGCGMTAAGVLWSERILRAAVSR